MRRYFAICAVFLSGFAMTGAQETAIESEVRKVSAAMTAKGFICRTEKTGRAADKIEIKMRMSKDVLYYFAVVTGQGEATAHAASATLINQDKKVIPLAVQNMEFGSVLQLHPLSNGMKTLKFALQLKTDYALAVCTNKASLYHTEQKNSPLDDHSHF